MVCKTEPAYLFFGSSTLKVPSHNSVRIAETNMNPIWIYKSGDVYYTYLSKETLCLWFEALYVESTILMTEAVKLEYFEGAINENIKFHYVLT